MSDYNEFLISDMEPTCKKLIEVMRDDESFNLRGAASMLMLAGSMSLHVMKRTGSATKEETEAISECMEILDEQPMSVHYLLIHLSKMFIKAHHSATVKGDS